MTDDVRSLSAELARNPDSLVFLELGEALRARGKLDASAQVAVTGLEGHPDRPEAHDLYARILLDMNQYNRAYEEWMAVIELDSQHVGARKGLGFLCYRWNDLESALDHLELALAVDPMDQSVVQALRMVRDQAASLEARLLEEDTSPSIFAGFEGAEHGLLLADSRGRVLGGGLRDESGRDVAEDVAAYVAGACQEADRTSRMLEIGSWDCIVVEAPGGSVHVSRPAADALLVVARDRSVPSGRLAMLSERATHAARQWLETQQL